MDEQINGNNNDDDRNNCGGIYMLKIDGGVSDVNPLMWSYFLAASGVENRIINVRVPRGASKKEGQFAEVLSVGVGNG